MRYKEIRRHLKNIADLDISKTSDTKENNNNISIDNNFMQILMFVIVMFLIIYILTFSYAIYKYQSFTSDFQFVNDRLIEIQKQQRVLIEIQKQNLQLIEMQKQRKSNLD